MKNPIIAALDVDDPKRAQDLFSKLSKYVGGFKVGPRLTFRADKSFLKDISQAGILFFDHKFFDIPSTTVSAVKVAAELGAHWITVHALNGPQCLKDLSVLQDAQRKENPNFRILAVTVLTSFSPETLPPIWSSSMDIPKSVEALTRSGIKAGLDSFVCSPEEIKLLKQNHEQSFLVVPGIRPQGEEGKDDQKRTATPDAALKAGASALVIGRPIIEAKDPVMATQKILESFT